MVINEESETQASRGSQEVRRISYDPDSDRGMEIDLCSTGNLNVGIGRADWQGSDSYIPIVLGGIVEQLLENEIQRLAENQECIEWYEREKNKTQARIEKLKQLRDMATEPVNQLAGASEKIESFEED